MENCSDVRLAQYRVAADHRLHFGRLFVQVVAFNLALSLATIFVVGNGPVGWTIALDAAGLILIGTAGVSSRLLYQERRYASAMAEIEKVGEGFMALPAPSALLAHRLTIFGLGIAGVVLLAGSVLV